MKLKRKFLEISGKNQSQQNPEIQLDQKFSSFMLHNFIRKNQKLDKIDFEIKFYQNAFSDLLSNNPNITVCEFVCPTSSRPILTQLQNLNPQEINSKIICQFKKLPSRFCTINSIYLETIFESKIFRRMFLEILDNHFEKFAICQIKTKFEVIVSGWRNLFIKKKHSEDFRQIFEKIRHQILDARVKLPWCLRKIRIARKILKTEFRNNLRRISTLKNLAVFSP